MRDEFTYGKYEGGILWIGSNNPISGHPSKSSPTVRHLKAKTKKRHTETTLSLVIHSQPKKLVLKENSQRANGIHFSAIHQSGHGEVSCQERYISSTG